MLPFVLSVIIYIFLNLTRNFFFLKFNMSKFSLKELMDILDGNISELRDFESDTDNIYL